MKQQLPALGVWFGRLPSLLLGIVVLATLCMPALVHISGQSSDPTFLDNRRPAPLPALPITIDRLDKFRDNITRYIGDNFGLRAELVQLNVWLHARIGVSAVPSLTIGKDGWAFLKSDFEVFDQFRGLNRFTGQELDDWIDDMENYRQWLEEQGSGFMIAVAPSQQTVYPEYMPMNANRVWPETRLDQIVRRLRERQSKLNLIDLRPHFWAARNQEQLYHKYENHWNRAGAFVGYSAIMRHLKEIFPGVEPLRLEEFDRSSEVKRWPIPPSSEIVPVLKLKKPSHVRKTEVLATTSRVPVPKTTTDLAEAPDVLVYGDSFAAYELLTWFNESFRSTIFLQTNHAPFPSDLVVKERPKLVMFQLVERYLARPLDFGPEFELRMLGRRAPDYQDAKTAIGIAGGVVDGVYSANGRAVFTGWAVDHTAKAPANAIFAFYGDRLVGAARPTVLRGDVTRGMADQKAGFSISVRSDLDKDPDRRLRFFSVNPSGNIYEIVINAPLAPRVEDIFR